MRSSISVTVIMFGLLALQVIAGRLYGGSLAQDIAVTIIVVACVAAIGVIVMWALPHPDGVPWTAMVPGAILLAVGLEALRIATAVYFAGKLERIDDLYGALGVSAVFLTWLYIVGRLMVTGIELNATTHGARHPRVDGEDELTQAGDAEVTAPIR